MQHSRSGNLILILIAAGFIMKLFWIGEKELAHDEPFTVLQAHRSLAGLFSILPEENNPPLHFILVHFWLELVPLDAGWLRMPSTLFSALTVWPLFLLGRSLGNIRVAVIASLLFIFSTYHFGFAHEVRAYSLFALLATTSMWQLLRIVKGHGIFWLIVTNILLVYTHFFGWLMIGIQFLCIISIKEWRHVLKSFFATSVVVMLAYLPYGLIFLRRLNTSVSEGTWLTPPVPEELYNMLWRWSNVPVAVILMMSIMIFHYYRTKGRDVLTRMGTLWAFVPLIGMFAASQFVPMFLDRYLIYASPGYYLLCAMALDNAIPMERYRYLAPTIAISIFAFTFTPWDNSWPVPSKVIRATEEFRIDADIPVLIHPWWYSHTYAWHTDRTLFEEPDRLQEKLQERNIHTLSDIRDLNTEMEAHQEIILIVAGAEEERRSTGEREKYPIEVIATAHPHEHVRIHHLRLKTKE